MSREAFLARVRQAVAAGMAYRTGVRRDLPADAGYLGAGHDPCQRMADEVQAVGGVAHLVDDPAAARAALDQLLEHYAPQTALCWRHPLLERLDVADLLAGRKVKLINHNVLNAMPADDQRGEMLAADIGITSASWAVAETGTLAMASMPGCERSASLLPPVHVALVERSQILPDLFDLFERLESDGLDSFPTNLALITGPSKTGDIQLRLTTGVHGPKHWHVIIVR